MLIKDNNGTPEPYSINKLKRDNPGVSFPKNIPAATLAEYGVYEVQAAPQPDIDRETQTAESSIEKQNGEWVQVWTVRDLTSEELLARTPRTITLRQGHEQLIEDDLYDTIITEIGNIQDPKEKLKTENYFYRSNEWEFNHPRMIAMAEKVGITEQQRSELFKKASKL